MSEKKYPIGVQDFKKLREGGFCYVDKTDLVYRLVHSGANAFMSRPRRFGKSLLCSTLKYYFLGERELFSGLAIEKMEQDWVKHPVLHMELNQVVYTCTEDLQHVLSGYLTDWEAIYGKGEDESTLTRRFAGVMRRAHKQSGQKVAVIIDEYDKPLLDTVGKGEVQDDVRTMLKSFYGVMKPSDQDIQFIFLTGVTKFSKVSVFSDLNNLHDVSMSDQVAGICGITNEELDGYFAEDIEQLAEAQGNPVKEMREKLREVYDGYHFSPCLLDVYNPFSVLNAFSMKRIEHYWFATGTPTYLTYLLKYANYDLRKLSGIDATASRLSDISEPERDPIPILFQSGYLTIKGYDAEFDSYILDFPNREVRQGFFNALLPQYNLRTDIYGNDFNIGQFVMAVRNGDIDGFLGCLKSLFANIPYTQATDQRQQRIIEQQYQNVVYIVFTLMGFYTEVEHHTALGRIDLVVKTPQYIYIMEFKVGNGTAEDALQQINEKHYADPYTSDSRQLMKVGIGFDNETHNMDEWVIAEA